MLKIPRFVPFGANLTQFGLKCEMCGRKLFTGDKSCVQIYHVGEIVLMGRQSFAFNHRRRLKKGRKIKEYYYF